jgi:SlyX protein
MTENVALRLTELEVKLTFIDDTVQALAAADAEQTRRLASLERMVRELRGALSLLQLGQGENSSLEPPPPHY